MTKRKRETSEEIYWSSPQNDYLPKNSPVSPFESFYSPRKITTTPWINSTINWDERHIKKAFRYLLEYKYRKYKFIAIVKGFNTYRTDILTIQHPSNMIESHIDFNAFAKYLDSSHKHIKLIIAPFRVEFKNFNKKKNKEEILAHQNLLIINKVFHTFEFYDPHGYDGVRERSLILEPFLQQIHPSLEDYVSLIYSSTCPRFGFQTIENRIPSVKGLDNDGYCINWSLFLLDLRIKYYIALNRDR